MSKAAKLNILSSKRPSFIPFKIVSCEYCIPTKIK